MSPVALGLDILLVALLLVALTMGVRLNRRLKTLRESQAGFIAAVAELDSAALRAETALKALRAASEDAHDTLLDRIEAARALVLKLEAATAAVETARAVAQTASLPQQVPQALVRAEARLDPRFRELEQRLAARRSAVLRGVDDDLFEADEPPVRAGSHQR
jgi:prophage DNA circulation protein